MNLPNTLKIAGFDIQIVEVSVMRAASDNFHGQFSSCEQTIQIQPHRATMWQLLDTLLHEINHAIYWAYGLDDADKEERIVGMMATAWTQIYRDNPDLVRLINEATAPTTPDLITDPMEIMRRAGLN